VYELLMPGAPLRQSDMNEKAFRDYEEADAELKSLVQHLSTLLRPDLRPHLQNAQSAWVGYRKMQSAFEAEEVRGGTMEPLARWGAAFSITKDRIDTITEQILTLEGR